jgi:RNA polymerase sigma-B factor
MLDLRAGSVGTRISPSTAADRRHHDELTHALLRAGRPDRQDTLRRAVELNLCLAAEISARFSGRGVDDDELRQIAALGLVKAVRTFQADRDSSFLAFAQQTITGELKRYFRDHAWLVRIPRRLHEVLGDVQKVAGEHAPAGIAARIDRSEQEVTEALRARRCRQGLPLAELSDRPADVDAEVERIETADLVRSVLAALDPRSRTILFLRYVEERGQADIGRFVGLSQVQVSREIRRALRLARERGTELVQAAG